MILIQCLKGFFVASQRKNNPDWTGERVSPRYNVTLFARFRGNGPFIERRGNVGIGGFCFEGEREFLEGSEVDLLFRLPNTTEWIHARGRVLGQTEAHGWLGIRGHFTDISFENERMLARWLDDMSLQLRTRSVQATA